MTNYNDGNWHGWNGGECPVHPKSEVEGIYIYEGRATGDSPFVDAAEEFDWAREAAYTLVRFRVVKEYREPRECWSYGAHIRDSLAEAEAFRAAVDEANPGKGYGKDPITHWVEKL